MAYRHILYLDSTATRYGLFVEGRNPDGYSRGERLRNLRDDEGNRRARIHSVAFPVYYEVTGSLMSAADYAALMRDLSQRNGGSFIALPVD